MLICVGRYVHDCSYSWSQKRGCQTLLNWSFRHLWNVLGNELWSLTKARVISPASDLWAFFQEFLNYFYLWKFKKFTKTFFLPISVPRQLFPTFQKFLAASLWHQTLSAAQRVGSHWQGRCEPHQLETERLVHPDPSGWNWILSWLTKACVSLNWCTSFCRETPTDAEYSKPVVFNLWVETPWGEGHIPDIYSTIHNSNKVTAVK